MKLFFLLIIMYVGHLNAQHTFYQTLDFNFSTHLKEVIELEDVYIFCGYENRISPLGDNLLLVKINKKGDLIWEKRFDYDYESVYNSLIDTDDGFIAGGTRIDGDATLKLLSKYDYDGNLLWEKTYATPIEHPSGQSLATLSKLEEHILLGGAVFDPDSDTQDAQLLKTDQLGNILWSKNYGLDDGVQKYNDFFVKVIPTKDAIYTASQSIRWSDAKYFNTLIKTDLDGNELWRKEMRVYTSELQPTFDTLLFNTFTILPNGNVLVLFVKYNQTALLNSLVFIEFNADGNEVNFAHKAYSYPLSPSPRSNMMVNKAGEIFISGGQDLDYTDSLFFQVYAAKFSANYELEWERNFGEKNQNDFHETSVITNDNGVIVTGQFLHLTKVKIQAFIIKLDCKGNLVWDFESCILPDSPEIKIFPNPFSTEFNIHLPEIELEDNVEISLFSVAGQLMYTQNL